MYLTKALPWFACALVMLVVGIGGQRVDAATYDLVINGGRVIDPASGTDAMLHLGIQGDRIAILSDTPLTGEQQIDATDLVVTAGFIDPHFHWPRPTGYRLALRDGVTTAMDLEFGTRADAIDDWYAMQAGNSPINFGSSVSQELTRTAILTGAIAMDAPDVFQSTVRSGSEWAHRVPDPVQYQQIMKSLDNGLRSGALGIGSTLGYLTGVTAREMFATQALAAEYGRATFVHLRHSPGDETSEPNGAQEVLQNAAALSAPLGICHFNNPGWQLTHELLVRARAQGHNVWGEYYPYAAGSTTIGAHFLEPDHWEGTLGKRYEDTLMDPQTNTFYTRERYLETRKNNPQQVIVLFKSPVSEIPRWIRMPGAVLGSDGMPTPSPGWDKPDTLIPFDTLANVHPRTAGARAKALRIARELGIPLMQVLATMNANPARYLGATGLEAMKQRGQVAAGMIADITIFDPERVTDNATYQHGTRPSTGFTAVIVNGQIVLRDDTVLTDARAGQAVRFPMQAAGRYKPATNWDATHLVPLEEDGHDGT